MDDLDDAIKKSDDIWTELILKRLQPEGYSLAKAIHKIPEITSLNKAHYSTLDKPYLRPWYREIVRKALIEIELLNYSSKEKYLIKNQTKISQWRTRASKYYSSHREDFKLILPEDFKNDSIFSNLENAKSQFIRDLRMNFIREILKRNGITNLGVRKIKQIIDIVLECY